MVTMQTKFCEHCRRVCVHSEVLLSFPVRGHGMVYARDFACLACGNTLNYGLLPPAASNTFLLPVCSVDLPPFLQQRANNGGDHQGDRNA